MSVAYSITLKGESNYVAAFSRRCHSKSFIFSIVRFVTKVLTPQVIFLNSSNASHYVYLISQLAFLYKTAVLCQKAIVVMSELELLTLHIMVEVNKH